MNRRDVLSLIVISVMTSSATTFGIMYYQAQQLFDQLEHVGRSDKCPESDQDCLDALIDGEKMTKEQYKKRMDELLGEAI